VNTSTGVLPELTSAEPCRGRKFGASATMTQRPVRTPIIANRPLSSVVEVIRALTASLVARTVAPLIGLPSGSLMVPVILPAVCADTAAARASVRVAKMRIRRMGGSYSRTSHGLGDREARAIEIAHRDRHVSPEAEHAEPIDPRVVAGLRAAGILHVSQLWSRKLIERPALGTLLARRCRLPTCAALSAIEAREMSAGQRDPEHAVAIDVSSARSEAGRRRLVDFRERGLSGIRSRHDADDEAAVPQHRSPDGTVGRAHGNRIGIDGDACVFGKIRRLTGFHVGIAPAVAVRVD